MSQCANCEGEMIDPTCTASVAMTIVAAVRASVITAHAASGLLLVRTVLVARPVRVVHIRIAPPRPRVVALEVSPPNLSFDTVFYSFAPLQPLDPVSFPSFQQLSQNALLPTPRDLPGIRRPTMSLCRWTTVRCEGTI